MHKTAILFFLLMIHITPKLKFICNKIWRRTTQLLIIKKKNIKYDDNELNNKIIINNYKLMKVYVQFFL